MVDFHWISLNPRMVFPRDLNLRTLKLVSNEPLPAEKYPHMVSLINLNHIRWNSRQMNLYPWKVKTLAISIQFDPVMRNELPKDAPNLHFRPSSQTFRSLLSHHLKGDMRVTGTTRAGLVAPTPVNSIHKEASSASKCPSINYVVFNSLQTFWYLLSPLLSRLWLSNRLQSFLSAPPQYLRIYSLSSCSRHKHGLDPLSPLELSPLPTKPKIWREKPIKLCYKEFISCLY